MNVLDQTKQGRLARARLSLEGLSVGDAFGELFFAPGNVGLHASRQAPPPIWPYTDDTAMAISIVRELELHGEINQDDLAARFATAFHGDPGRGYGAGAIRLLTEINRGAAWRDASYGIFEGQGSMGNGGAMRVAPLGAYFAGDLDQVVEQAGLSAEVTHAHPEGQAGAIAVALAAAVACEIRGGREMKAGDVFDQVIDRMPDGLTRVNLKQAAVLPHDTAMQDVVHTLGNGSRVIAYDTVPYSLWCAFHNISSYTDAIWTCASGGGDVDTNCAIVGGVVALAVGYQGVPKSWIRSRETLPYVTNDKA